MTPACWCGRWRHHSVQVIGNSCGQRCPGYSVCESPGPKCERFCQKLCHPGPCEPVVCVTSCVTVRFPRFKTGKSTVTKAFHSLVAPPRAVTRAPANRSTGTVDAAASWRNAARPRNTPPRPNPASEENEVEGTACDIFCMLIFGLLILAALEMGLGYWVVYHKERWIHPLRHRFFTEELRTMELVFSILVGMLIVGLVKTFLWVWIIYFGGKFLKRVFKLNSKANAWPFLFCLVVSIALADVCAFPVA